MYKWCKKFEYILFYFLMFMFFVFVINKKMGGIKMVGIIFVSYGEFVKGIL